MTDITQKSATRWLSTSIAFLTLAAVIVACAPTDADGHAAPVASDQTADAAVASVASVASTGPATPSATPIRVYKDPTCRCCEHWVKYMNENGFQATTVDESAAAMDSIKKAHGITEKTASCHTAEVGDYVVEGHVPADLVQQLLREHPADIAGLAVPGMVTGSPGMDGPNPKHYTVVAIMRDGTTRPYAQR
jgi:hypothetical protein